MASLGAEAKGDFVGFELVDVIVAVVIKVIGHHFRGWSCRSFEDC